jgi:RNA polymerase sigma-70 factor (ECF subfamily)
MQTGEDWKNQLQELHRESYLWSLSCCNYDKEMAKDVLQNVYLKIYDGKASFNEKSKLKTWMFSIIKFTSIDFMRKYGMRVEELNADHYQISDEEMESESDKSNLFINILLSLSGQQRKVLTLAFYHDLTLEEIAALLEISIGTARTHYERGKENFKKHLTRYKLDTEGL